MTAAMSSDTSEASNQANQVKDVVPKVRLETCWAWVSPHAEAELQSVHAYLGQLFFAAVKDSQASSEQKKNDNSSNVVAIKKMSAPFANVFHQLCLLANSLVFHRILSSSAADAITSSTQPIVSLNNASIDDRRWALQSHSITDAPFQSRFHYLKHVADLTPKFKLIAERALEVVVDEKEKMVVFVEYLDFGKLIADQLNALQFRVEFINGNMPQYQRDEIIRRFNDSANTSIEVLVVTYQTPLAKIATQDKCSVAIFAEPATCRKQELVAIGRMMRVSKEQDCKIVRVYGANTIDKYREWEPKGEDCSVTEAPSAEGNMQDCLARILNDATGGLHGAINFDDMKELEKALCAFRDNFFRGFEKDVEQGAQVFSRYDPLKHGVDSIA